MPNLTERERELVDLIRTYWFPIRVHAHAPLRWAMKAYENKDGFYQIYIMGRDFEGDAPPFVEAFYGIRIAPGDVKIQLFLNRGHEEREVERLTYDVTSDDFELKETARDIISHVMAAIRKASWGLEAWAKKNAEGQSNKKGGAPGNMLIDVQ